MTTNTNIDRQMRWRQYQKKLEREALERGASQTKKHQQKAINTERETTTETGSIILSGAIAPLAMGIDSWLWGKGAGFGKKVKPYFKLLEPELMAVVIARTVIDGISKQRKRTALAGSIGRAIQREHQLQEFMKKHKHLATVKLKGLATETDYTKERMILSEMRKTGVLASEWSSRITVEVGMVALSMMEEYIGMVSPTEEMSEWLKTSYELTAANTFIYEPMITEPIDWTTTYDGGYTLEEYQDKGLFVNSKGRYKTLQYHHVSEMFDAVNHLQSTAWRVNTEVLDIITELWNNNSEIADLPNRDFIPEPDKPLNTLSEKARKKSIHELTPEEQGVKRTWATYYQKVKAIRIQNNINISKRFKVHDNISTANKFCQYKQIYFPHHLDFINPQGDDMSKGLLMFSEAKPIVNKEQEKYFYTHGANMFGVKGSYGMRVEWVQRNKEWLMRMADEPLIHTGWADASNPFQFLAWLLEYKDYERYGVSHLSRLPIAMDGSCNGIQIMSLILNDNIMGEKTNCLPTKSPNDIYQEVADSVRDKLKSNPDRDSLKVLKAEGVQIPKIDRKLLKKAVMSVPYGGNYYTVFDSIYSYSLEFLASTNLSARRYKQTRTMATKIATVAWESIQELLPQALELSKYLKEKAKAVILSGKEITWHSPIGFRVSQGYKETIRRRITTAIGTNVRRAAHYGEEQDSFSVVKNLNGIVPNYIHSIDSSIMLMTTNLMKEQEINNLSMVHDSFATHAMDAPKLASGLRKIYLKVFSKNLIDMFDMDMQSCYPEIQESQTQLKRGALDINQLTKSLYLFS